MHAVQLVRFCCELRDAGIQWPDSEVLMEHGRMIDCHTMAPSDVKNHFIKGPRSGGGKRMKVN